MQTNNTPTAQRILVIGATGKQGSAVIRHLLNTPFLIRALVRNSADSAAQALSQNGIEVVTGDLDDRASVDAAMQDVYGVFSMQTFINDDFARETRQGILVVDAAVAADVKHFVYSSVGSADKNTGVPHFDSKWAVEKHLHTTALPYTVVRPVYFMENWELMREQILAGTLAQPLSPDKPLQQLSVNDLGAFTAQVFSQPDRWLGRTIELAGDALTMPQTAELFSRVLGRPVQYVPLPFEQFESFAGQELTLMYRWLDQVGYQADLAQLRREGIPLTSLETYLNQWDRAGN